jgi:hypothetical protein
VVYLQRHRYIRRIYEKAAWREVPEDFTIEGTPRADRESDGPGDSRDVTVDGVVWKFPGRQGESETDKWALFAHMYTPNLQHMVTSNPFRLNPMIEKREKDSKDLKGKMEENVAEANRVVQSNAKGKRLLDIRERKLDLKEKLFARKERKREKEHAQLIATVQERETDMRENTEAYKKTLDLKYQELEKELRQH